jgi:hypothetical protein
MKQRRNNVLMGGALMVLMCGSVCGSALGAITYTAAKGSSYAWYWEGGYVTAGAGFVRDPAQAPDYYVLRSVPRDPPAPPMYSDGSANYTVWCRPDRLYTIGSTWVWNTPQLMFSESGASMALHVEFTTDAEVDFAVRLRPYVDSLHDVLTGSLRSVTTEYLSSTYQMGLGEWSGKLGPGSYVLDLSIRTDAPLSGTINDGSSRYYGGAFWEVSIPTPGTLALLSAGVIGLASAGRRR